MPAAAFGEVEVAAAAVFAGFVVAGAVVEGRVVAAEEDGTLEPDADADADAEPLGELPVRMNYLKV